VVRFPSVFGGKVKELIPLDVKSGQNITFDKLAVDKTIPTKRVSNIVPNQRRTNKNFKLAGKRPLSLSQFVSQQSLIQTAPTKRDSNVVPKDERLLSTVNQVDKLPVELNTVKVNQNEVVNPIG